VQIARFCVEDDVAQNSFERAAQKEEDRNNNNGSARGHLGTTGMD
jgi:hypothetical protein